MNGTQALGEWLAAIDWTADAVPLPQRDDWPATLVRGRVLVPVRWNSPLGPFLRRARKLAAEHNAVPQLIVFGEPALTTVLKLFRDCTKERVLCGFADKAARDFEMKLIQMTATLVVDMAGVPTTTEEVPDGD